MPLISLKILLNDLAKNEMSNNTFARVIEAQYDNLDLSTTDTRSNYEGILKYYKQYVTLTSLPEVKEINNDNIFAIESRDYRLSSLLIRNVRGIPQSDDYPFGFNFNNENSKNCSAIILGANGSGKSSIYSALEFIFCNEIGEAKLRTTNPKLELEDYEKYLIRYDGDFKDTFCEILTNSGLYTLENRIFTDEKIFSKINPQTHFISDYDIYSNGQLDFEDEVEYSFHNQVANQLGLGDFLRFSNIIKSISSYRRAVETKDINKKNNTIESNKKNIREWSNQLQEKQHIYITFDELFKNSPNSEILSKLRMLSERLEKGVNIDNNWANSNEIFQNYRSIFLELSSLLTDKIEIKESQFLALGVDLLKIQKQCPFCNDSRKNYGQILNDVNIRIQGAREYATKNDILNSLFEKVLETFNSIFNKYQLVNQLFDDDQNLLISFNELNDVLEKEKYLTTEIATYLEDEFANSISKIDKKSGFNPNEQKKVFDLLIKFEEQIKLYDNVINKINTLLNNRESVLKQTIESIENKVDELKGKSEQQAILKNEIDNIKKQISATTKENELLLKQINELEKEKDLSQKFKAEANEFSLILDVRINKIVQESFNPIETLFNHIINEYYKDEDDITIEPYFKEKIVGDITTSYIAVQINKKNPNGTQSTISPERYFNTFRYRIFCSLISLSIALASRILTKTNLPLVFDDIFYAADYQSRTTIQLFLVKIISLFKTFTPDLPLQIIFFTNDELVFDCAKKSILEYPDLLDNEEVKNKGGNLAEEWQVPMIERTIFARLFPPNEKEEKPSGSEDKFWDLLYTFHTQVK